MILISAREIPDWIYAKHQFVNLLKMNGFESLMSTGPLSGEGGQTLGFLTVTFLGNICWFSLKQWGTTITLSIERLFRVFLFAC